MWFDKTCLPQDIYLPAYTISAEEIFKGDILLFDVDFFNQEGEIFVRTANDNVYKVSDYSKAKLDEILKNDGGVEKYFLDENEEEYAKAANGNVYKVSDYSQSKLDEIIKNDGGVKNYFYKDDEGNEVITSKQNTAKEIRGVISQWYASIRNIALVLMMSVLLYIAIRMLLTTIAQDKAKYKQMMVDWVVGMCLLFFMHYIMAFSVSIVKQFIKIIDSAYSEEMDTKYFVTMEDDDAEKLSKAMEEMGLSDNYQEGYITWNTNLMGQIRLQSQLTTSSTQYVGYSICFLVLVAYTVFFAFTYLKRVVYLAFLTMIAPLVALTYPIDKLNDGQAQGFNKWLKEYLFNLLIQPLHLLLYTVLVLSAFEFASLNVVYMLVAIGFLIPAEKVLRSFFGFEKSETAGSLAGAAVGAGLAAKGLQGLLQRGKSSSGGKSSTGNKLDGEKQPKFNKAFDSDRLKNNALGEGDNKDEDNSDDDGSENALKKYKSEGFGKNSSGHYYNPWTDEYDKNYNPAKDKSYNEKLNENKENKNTNMNNLNTEMKKRNIRAPRPLRALARPAKFLGKRAARLGRGSTYLAKQGAKRLVGKGANVLTKLPRYAANVIVGATTGTAAMALSLATGSLDTTVKATAGAAFAGGALANKFTSDELDGSSKQGYEKAYFGKDYEIVKEKNKWNEWRKNQENIEMLEKNFGKQRAKEMLKKDGDARAYINNDIDDVNDIIALEQMINDSNVEVNNQVEAMGMYAYAQQSGDLSRMKAKDRGEWKNTYTADIKERCNYSDTKANEKGEQIYNSAMAFWKKRNSLK